MERALFREALLKKQSGDSLLRTGDQKYFLLLWDPARDYGESPVAYHGTLCKVVKAFFFVPTLKAEMSGTVPLPSTPELQQHTEARDTLK